MRSREKHAEFVKKWFDDVALEDVAEDAAENGKGDDDARFKMKKRRADKRGSKGERMSMRMRMKTMKISWMPEDTGDADVDMWSTMS